MISPESPAGKPAALVGKLHTEHHKFPDRILGEPRLVQYSDLTSGYRTNTRIDFRTSGKAENGKTEQGSSAEAGTWDLENKVSLEEQASNSKSNCNNMLPCKNTQTKYMSYV